MPHVDLSPIPERLDVTTDWSEKELIKAIPGARWDSARSTWHVPMTWAACVQLRGTFGQRLVMSDDVRTWAWARKEEVERAVAWRGVIDPGTPVEGLYPWQVADYYWAHSAGSGMLLGNDQGTGKTRSVEVMLRNLADALPALVITPNSVKRVWEAEARAAMPDVNVYAVAGGASARVKIIKQALEDLRAVIVINYESLRSHSRLAPYGSVRLKRCQDCGGEDEKVRPSQCHVHRKELNGTGVIRSVGIDEAHRLKDPTSQQTRAVWAVCHDPSVTRRIAMTGTPIANHVGDLWSIMHAVAPEEYPVRSAFLDRYALMSWNKFGGLDIVGVRQDRAAEFFSFFDARYRRVTKAEAAPWLPEKFRSVRYATLPTKMLKAYRELDEQLITRLDDGTIAFATNNLTQSIRLLQMASAYGTVIEDGSYRLAEPSPKLDIMEEVIAEREGRPLVVAALSRQLVELGAARLEKAGIPHAMITGAVAEYDRRRNLDLFQAGRLPVLLVTIGAGGEGLTMTAADTILFLQRSWSVIQNLQMEDRVHRIGSEVHDAIHVIDVITENTIEEEQIVRVQEKLQRLEEIRRDGGTEMPFEDDLRIIR